VVFGGRSSNQHLASDDQRHCDAGKTLTASTGSWSGTIPISYAYQWLRCDSSGIGPSAPEAADEVGPGVAGGDVGHGQLPEGAACALQATDEETVDADQLAGPLGVDVHLRGGRTPPRASIGLTIRPVV
jgi:hypothetical protein